MEEDSTHLDPAQSHTHKLTIQSIIGQPNMFVCSAAQPPTSYGPHELPSEPAHKKDGLYGPILDANILVCL